MSIPSNWYEDFFHGVTLDLWRKAIPQKQTEAEASFLINNIGCDRSAHLLDVPCGNGRLSFEMAKHGYRVTGVDLSEEFIEEARSATPHPPANASGPASVAPASRAWTGETPVPQFILGDMRRVEGESIYDGAYCFGNSFGFLEYRDMEKFLDGVTRSLKTGARFIIETAMAAESVLPDFEEQTSHEIADITMTVKERYIAEESCIDSEYIFEHDGKTESRKAKHWIYTAAEIRRMSERAGLEVINTFGSLDGGPYKLGSRELFVIAQRV